jgi:uncharacterized coiled-coil protein SlyX
MSLGRKLLSAAQRAVGTTPDAAAVSSRLDELCRQIAAQTSLIEALNHRVSTGDVAAFRAEFDSIASAHAEGMVYLNRSLREIRAEVMAISRADKSSLPAP